MARRPRIDLPGYHHIVNRGVNRSDIFVDDEDREVFVRIMCKASRIYDATVHDYCLMDNHYHLLLENRQENLSLLMRQINANYAIYFNKKHHRTGHLWQGRFSSWYILGDDYLYRTIRYIEHNPIEAGIVSQVRDYDHTLAGRILRGESVPECAEDSLLLRRYDISTLAGFLAEPLTQEEVDDLESQRQQNIVIKGRQAKQIEKKPLESYFGPGMDRPRRNQAIHEAYRDGHTQRSIAAHLGLTDAAVNIIIKKFRI